MSEIMVFPEIEQIDFFAGQRLYPNDLQAIDEVNRQLRWLHNSSLHTWGIAAGLQVSAEVGDREVKISPGYAVDNLGREIILLENRVVPLPPVAGDKDQPAAYYLTVQYPPEEKLEETETRSRVCSSPISRRAIRRGIVPIFCWIMLQPDGAPENGTHRNQIATGEKIVLGRFEVKNCRLELPLSSKQRRGARPAPTPYVACGMTKGETKWQILSANGIIYGLKAKVDTSAARFKTTPCYTARVAGKRFFLPEEVKLLLGEQKPFLLETSVFIHQKPKEPSEHASPAQFYLQALMPEFGFPIAGNNTEQQLKINPQSILKHENFERLLNEIAEWHVVWTGVEE